MFPQPTPQNELFVRCRRLQQKMAVTGTGLCFILQKADLFYFTGTVQGDILIIPAEGEPLYLVRKNLERVKAESLLENILTFRSFNDLPGVLNVGAICESPIQASWGLELDVLPANFYLRLQELFPKARWADVSPIIRQVRAVKSQYELGIMQEAAKIAHHIAVFAAEILKEGLREWEWAAAIKGEALRAGHQGLTKMRRWNQEFFFGHVLSGESAGVPAYIDSPTGGQGTNPFVGSGAGWRKLGRNEPLSVDVVGAWGGYMVDQARMYSLGELSPEIKKAYGAVLEMEKELASMLKPGVLSSHIYKSAQRMAAEMGYEEFFMNFGENKVNFVGHGVGIELDEFPIVAPNFDMPLEAGMTIALEPKIIFPQKGMAGIEDTYVVTDDGGQQLSITAKDIFEL